MTVHAVLSAGNERGLLAPTTLDELQWEQHQHDEQYHREIVRLTVHERWKHMALHFAKYAGSLVGQLHDEDRVLRSVVDTFIIALSTSNTLNVRASALYSQDLGAVPTDMDFLSRLMIGAGKMAAACEKLDHIEPYPFREEVTAAVADLLNACVSFSAIKGWQLDKLARTRLAGVKAKWIHHGR